MGNWEKGGRGGGILGRPSDDDPENRNCQIGGNRRKKVRRLKDEIFLSRDSWTNSQGGGSNLWRGGRSCYDRVVGRIGTFSSSQDKREHSNNNSGTEKTIPKREKL